MHDITVGFEYDHLMIAVTDDPIMHLEPPEIPPGQSERDAAVKAIRFLLEAIGSRGITAKVLALRYVLHIEDRPMEVVGGEHGLCRATISHWVGVFADSFGLPGMRTVEARIQRGKIQREVWKKRHNSQKSASSTC
jgi:hypothetical protein